MSIVFRKRGDGNLTASIRTDHGIHDIQLRAGRWWCSCGTADCTHVGAVGDALLAPGVTAQGADQPVWGRVTYKGHCDNDLPRVQKSLPDVSKVKK